MTDSILRAYYNVSSSMFVPFAQAVSAAHASTLLSGETQGFAIDATTYDAYTPAAYVGGPVGGTVTVIDTGTPANNLTDVALDGSNLTQTGTSPKMVTFPTSPYVRWTPHNYVIQSQTLDTGDWTTSSVTVTANDTAAPDGATTAEKCTETGGGASIRTTSLVTVLTGVTYTASIFAKASNITWLQFNISDDTGFSNASIVWFNVASGTAGTTSNTAAGTGMGVISSSVTSSSNGFYRLSVTFTVPSSKTAMFIWFDSATADASTTRFSGGTGVYWLWGAQLVRGYNANPYLVTTSSARIGIPQAYDTAAIQYGILVEPVGTNLNLYSVDMNNAGFWNNPDSISISADDTVSPDGSTNASTLTAGSGTHYHTYGNAGVIYGSGNTITLSVYAKDGTGHYLNLNINQTNVQWFGAVFDLSDGTIGTTGAGSGAATYISSSISAIGDGWYRCAVTGTCGASGNTTLAIAGSKSPTIPANDFGILQWNAAGTETIKVYGFQCEEGSTASSYIPTLGSTVTRAADSLKAINTTYPFSATAGTVIDYFKLVNYNTLPGHFWNINDGTTNERIALYASGGNTATFFIADGGATQANAAPGTNATVTAGTAKKVGCAWAANDAAIVADNGTVGTDASVTLPTMTQLYIGQDESPFALNTYTYQFTYLPRRATNGELQTKTT